MSATPDILHPTAPRFNRRALALLCGLLLLAAAPRFALLQAGLPDYPHQDETLTVRYSLGVVRGVFNPHFYDWPGTLLFYFDGAVYLVYVLTGGSLADVSRVFVVARLPTLVSGLATVGLVFLALRRYSLPAAVAAALVVACAIEHVKQSSWALTDVPATFLLMASLWAGAKAADKNTGRAFFLAGLIGGLGCAIKYYCGVAGLGLAVAALMTRGAVAESQGQSAPVALSRRLRFVLLAAIGGVTGFIVGCPPSLFATHEVWRDLMAQFAHQAGGHFGRDAPYWTQLPLALGWGVLIAAAVGAIAAWREKREPLPRAVLATSIGYLAMLSASQVSFSRYTIPHTAMLAVLAGCGVAWVGSRKMWWVPLTLLIVAPTAWNTMHYVQARRMTDTRDLAKDWVLKRTQPLRIIRTSGGPNLQAEVVIAPYEKFPSQAVHERLAAREVDLVLLDSDSLAYFDNPRNSDPRDAVSIANHQKFYQLIAATWRLVHEVQPSATTQGPTVRIYVPPDANAPATSQIISQSPTARWPAPHRSR